MTPELRQQILGVLWPPGQARHASVWAVLDCARDPAIYRLLLESRLEFLCLYSGRLPRELELVAPHMVELLPGHRFTERLLDEGWGRSWGIFVSIEDAANLRHHLRKFLTVLDETGRKLIFRYFDPRVLGAYLPTCTAAELTEIFGPVDRFLVESASAGSVVEYSQQSGVLVVRQAPIGAMDAKV
ncbi:MAG: DUF4123 domain-containing protein [Betaproteobacteria bacterium]|jgi:hypothetical protein